MGNEKQQAMVDEFLKVLETTLRIKVTRVSFETMWSETGPESLRETSLLKYLDKVRGSGGFRGLCGPKLILPAVHLLAQLLRRLPHL